MKKRLCLLLAAGWVLCVLPKKSNAQDIPGIGSVTGLVTRVIKAIDLKVQRMQNQTIWLQNAQKVLENAMSELHLNEITEWVQRQKDLYSQYYNELWDVKAIITYYHRIKEIAEKQSRLVSAYSRAWGLLKQDIHFSPEEISFMSKVYGGILDETLQNVDQLFAIVSSFSTQMSDAGRMEIINAVADRVDENYSDLQRFNTENSLLSLQRTKDAGEAAVVKWMYGLE